MFFLKKLVGLLLAPGTVILLLLGYGLVRQALPGRAQTRGWPWICLGTACFILFATAPLPDCLLRSLENRWPPVVGVENLRDIKYLVVLSARLNDNSQAPVTSRLGDAAALRVVEGVRLYNLLAGLPVVVMSGGGESRAGEQMAAFAIDLGVPAAKVIAETASRDTADNARQVKAIVREEPFLLVTSASHMPRAMKIFQLQGLQPLAAPADFRGLGHFTVRAFIPQGLYLMTMETAMHEYLGLAYLHLFPDRAGK